MAEVIRQCAAGHLSLNAGNWECPWCENARLEAEVEQLRAKIEAALALHVRVETDESITCGTCDDLWPCPTVKALKGER